MRLIPLGGSQNDGLFRDPASEMIYFRKYREGKGEIFRSTKTRDISKARARRQEFMEELWGEKPIKLKRQTAGELWASWYEGMAQTKSKATAASINSSWRALAPYIENMFLNDITEEWWTNTYIPKKREEISPRTNKANPQRKFFNDRKWLSMFLLWCDRNKKADPFWKHPRLINPDPKTDEGIAYTNEQMEALHQHATLRMSALLVMGEEHFMRRSEAILLTWDRVRPNQTIHLRAQDTKIRKARTFPFNDRLAGLFEELKAEAKATSLNSAFVFPSLVHTNPDQPMSFSEHRTLWEGTCRKAGLPTGSRFHWLRHTGLTKAFKAARLDAARICHFAGLSLEEADKTYLHFKSDDLRGVENLVGAPQLGRGKFGENEVDANV